ncbi:MAG: hypothetical protein EOM05_06085 [Clostridia bacterium]|nr:hypothetical protein [Clostridia bacterium]
MIEILTYDEILAQMKAEFKEKSGFEADDATDIGIRLQLLAGQLFSQSADISFVSRQLFLQTATGEYLDMHTHMRGLSRQEATKAHGTARFFTSEAAQADIIIAQDTQCAISGEDEQRYVTTQEVTLLQGQTQVDVPIVATSSGKNGNAAVGVVTMLVNPPQGIISVTNITELTGGGDQESDELLRERIMQSYQKMSNGANLQFYKELAMQNPRVVSANVISAARGAGTIDVVFDTAEEEDEQITEIQNELDATFAVSREIGTDVKASFYQPKFINFLVYIKVKSGFGSSEVIAQCEDKINEYAESLRVGEDCIKARLGNVLYNIDGVDNYNIVSPYEDTSISGERKIKAYKITVTDVF